jgi:pyrimidine-nucleoside phosphorylase
MNTVELIRRKRAGGELAREEITYLVDGYVRNRIPDYQMSAFLMAICFTGMTAAETAVFTEVMLNSGDTIDLSSLPGTKVDKHSTGGVGDKVSLILAPMVAACGVPVPMISGRGLGHTGGTLDKLESIPGCMTSFTVQEYKDIIAETGLVLMGQTAEIAPADRKMYSLRDVTGTIESIPLIAASIMSKKLAEGIDALVLDIKTGSGAFMKERANALALAQTLVGIGTSFGKTTVGFLTDMDQPLGFTVGNWLEVVESVECLRGKDVPDLMEVTYILGGAMVHLGKRASTIEEGMAVCREAIASGKAYQKFLQIIRRQGGDVSVLEHPERYPVSRHRVEVKSPEQGYLLRFDTHRVGVLAGELGAGRRTLEDPIDPKAGIRFLKKRGDPVVQNEVIALIHTDSREQAERAPAALLSAIRIGETPAVTMPTVLEYIDHTGHQSWKG